MLAGKSDILTAPLEAFSIASHIATTLSVVS
jgi:hypothetical protein